MMFADAKDPRLRIPAEFKFNPSPLCLKLKSSLKEIVSKVAGNELRLADRIGK